MSTMGCAVICAESQLEIIGTSVKPVAASGRMSLFDMLKRYAFSFYEVMIRIEQLRSKARMLGSGSYGQSKVDDSQRDGMVACLKEMRVECENLDLTHTASMIVFAESEVQRKGVEYTFADMLRIDARTTFQL
jgi:hypothetical protein